MLRPEIITEYRGWIPTIIDNTIVLLFNTSFRYSKQPGWDIQVKLDLRYSDELFYGDAWGTMFQVNDFRQVNLTTPELNKLLYLEFQDYSDELGITTNTTNVFGTPNDVPDRIQELFYDDINDIVNNERSAFIFWPDTKQWKYDSVTESMLDELSFRVLNHPNSRTFGILEAKNGIISNNGNRYVVENVIPGLKVIHPNEELQNVVYEYQDDWVETSIDPDAERGEVIEPEPSFLSDNSLNNISDWNHYPEFIDSVYNTVSEQFIESLVSSSSLLKMADEISNEIEETTSLVTRVRSLSNAKVSLSNAVLREPKFNKLSFNLRDVLKPSLQNIISPFKN